MSGVVSAQSTTSSSSSHQHSQPKQPNQLSSVCIRTPFALAYVDELLSDYSFHPLKSQQFVFQRLLSLCGSATPVSVHIAQHTVRTLLAAVNLIELPPLPAGRKLISEQSAIQINSLIIQEATDEKPGRSKLELDGAKVLFDLLVEEISERIQSESIVTTIETLYYKVLNFVLPVHQIIVLCRVASDKFKSLVSELLDEQLGVLFTSYSQKQNKCSLRPEFVICAVSKYLELETTHIDPIVAINFLKQVATESTQLLYQPLIFRLLSKKTGTKYNQKEKLRSQIDEIFNKQLLSAEVEVLKPIIMETHREALRTLLQEIGPIIASNPNSLLAAFNRANIDRARVFSPPSVAAAVIWLIEQAQRGFQRHASFERAGPGIGELSPADQSWSGKAFAEAVMHINPTLSWVNVIVYLDDPAFRVENRSGFKLFVDVFLSVYKARNFPVELLYKEWANQDAQLTLLQNVIEHSDLFCLIDYPHRSVVQPSHSLKNVPDEKDSNIANWCCLDLTETLLSIADRGSHIQAVARILQPALPQCPDILLLAIFQIHTSLPHQSLRERIITALLPNFICQHPNAIAVLNVGWNSDVLPRKKIHDMILEAFVTIYVKASDDQQKLAKILDVAHDLKPQGLSELLGIGKELPFIIDLACLASKRDYLKLEKWLEDKYKDYKDSLIENILTQIKRRAPPSIIPSAQGIGATLTPDTVKILLKFVHAHIIHVPNHPLHKPFTEITNQMLSLQQQQQQQQVNLVRFILFKV
ncbi:hypothetical protein WR25_08815 [Diploscapter pachys]|uniref:CCR4-NOT transcription complex subunit 1 HEAT repeat domain-containing protein n=1 Tax=Diploscapter pachys TaxID=2018661 RepID=A0A2A2J7S1_9BILA|nr:hypothetical protein WR25_08815 [Diploscapter pachys]